jgi:hypothetical protein
VLRDIAARFRPAYEIAKATPLTGIRLSDPAGRRPDVWIRHRYERRLFLRANYLELSSTIPGDGPPVDGELTMAFRGPIGRQRPRLGWKAPVPGGEEWLKRHRQPVLEAAGGIEAVQTMTAVWSSGKRSWRLRVKTMSGSMVSGFMAALPITVPFEQREAAAFVDLVDALSSAGA